MAWGPLLQVLPATLHPPSRPPGATKAAAWGLCPWGWEHGGGPGTGRTGTEPLTGRLVPQAEPQPLLSISQFQSYDHLRVGVSLCSWTLKDAKPQCLSQDVTLLPEGGEPEVASLRSSQPPATVSSFRASTRGPAFLPFVWQGQEVRSLWKTPRTVPSGAQRVSGHWARICAPAGVEARLAGRAAHGGDWALTHRAWRGAAQAWGAGARGAQGAGGNGKGPGLGVRAPLSTPPPQLLTGRMVADNMCSGHWEKLPAQRGVASYPGSHSKSQSWVLTPVFFPAQTMTHQHRAGAPWRRNPRP